MLLSGLYYVFSLYLLMICFPKSFTLVEASILSQFNSVALISWLFPPKFMVKF